jgi:hypothetical protein
MQDTRAGLLKEARARSTARRVHDRVIDYDQAADLFRRFTSLDCNSAGPELARLQNLAVNVPPQALSVRGKIRDLFFRIASPILGRILRLASLASPFRAAYEMVLYTQQQQLETERRILDEVAAIGARLEMLESEVKSRRMSA